MRIGNRTLHPKRFDSFSKKTENLLGCNPLCQKSNAFLTVSPVLPGSTGYFVFFALDLAGMPPCSGEKSVVYYQNTVEFGREA